MEILEENAIARIEDQVGRTPIPNREQELKLIAKAQAGDIDARNTLVMAHQRFVYQVAYRMAGGHQVAEDYFMEGIDGLCEAIARYNLKSPHKLITFGVKWIKQRIHDYRKRMGHIAEIGPHRWKIARQIETYNEKRAMKGLPPASVAELAGALRKPQWLITEATTMCRAALSLDQPINDDGRGARTHLDLLVDHGNVPGAALDTDQFYAAIKDALAQCTEREAEILDLYYGLTDDPLTMEDIGMQFGITRERVRQIRNVALEKVEDRLRATLPREDQIEHIAPPLRLQVQRMSQEGMHKTEIANVTDLEQADVEAILRPN